MVGEDSLPLEIRSISLPLRICFRGRVLVIGQVHCPRDDQNRVVVSFCGKKYCWRVFDRQRTQPIVFLSAWGNDLCRGGVGGLFRCFREALRKALGLGKVPYHFCYILKGPLYTKDKTHLGVVSLTPLSDHLGFFFLYNKAWEES